MGDEKKKESIGGSNNPGPRAITTAQKFYTKGEKNWDTEILIESERSPGRSGAYLKVNSGGKRQLFLGRERRENLGVKR